jgi:hypothetical protein
MAAVPSTGLAKVNVVVWVRLQTLATIVAVMTMQPKVTMRIVIAPYF